MERGKPEKEKERGTTDFTSMIDTELNKFKSIEGVDKKINIFNTGIEVSLNKTTDFILEMLKKQSKKTLKRLFK